MEDENVKEVDLSKDVCPVNYLKAKIELSKLQPCRKLKLIFSDIRTAETVKKSLEKDGVEVSELFSIDTTFFFFASAKIIK